MKEPVYVRVSVSLRERLKELNDTEIRVLLALGLRINEERQCWPKMGDLADECIRSERQVQRAVGNLIRKEFVFVGQRVGGRGRPTVYSLNSYFSFGRYGQEQVQILAPFMAEDEKGDIRLTEKGPQKRVTCSTPPQVAEQLRRKGDTGGEKRVTSGQPPQLQPVRGKRVTQGRRAKKGDISDKKGDIGISAKRVTSPLASSYLQEKPYKKNHIRKTIDPAKKTSRDPRVKAILDNISQALGTDIPFYAKEGAAVKRALQMGFTKDQFIDCWRAMKKFSFWQGKWLPLAKVTENLGEFAKGRMTDGTGRNLSAAPTRRASIAHPEDLAKGW